MLGKFTLVAVLAALALAPAGSADVGDSASGSATVEKYVYVFSATGGANDSGAGTMEITSHNGSTGTASVRCLIVDGNDAVIVGTVTTSNDPFDLPVGSELLFTVTDNATPGAGSDRIDAFPVPFAPCDSYDAYLGDATDLVLVGEITVVESPTAAEQVADLIAELQAAPVGPGNSYVAKLESIADSIAAGDIQDACNQLGAFENEVNAQTGKKLTQTEADALLTAVSEIKTTLGCP